ncbi:MAG: hypothetical protein H6772_00740 [Pseudomonadales bacterium]|nr:hypothetical protein [Pseudomonadales bacterium]
MVIRTGTVGRGSFDQVAMSQDRIIYNSGYAIIFQASDLVKAGYSLLPIQEVSRDSHILQEWRSPVAIDINIARLIVPISDIPDHKNATKSQIARSYFGEKFLKNLKRIY